MVPPKRSQKYPMIKVRSSPRNNTTSPKEVTKQKNNKRKKRQLEEQTVHQKILQEIENGFKHSLLSSSSRENLLPTYTSILKQKDVEKIHVRQLDELQDELDKLLTSVVLRNRKVRSIFKDNGPNYPFKVGPISLKPASSNPISSRVKKRHKIKNIVKNSKIRKTASKAGMSRAVSFEQNSKKTDEDSSVGSTEPPFELTPIVDKFCPDVREEDVHLLENLIKDCINVKKFLSSSILETNRQKVTVRENSENIIFVKRAKNRVKKKQTSDYVCGPITRQMIAGLREDTASATEGSPTSYHAETNDVPKDKRRDAKRKQTTNLQQVPITRSRTQNSVRSTFIRQKCCNPTNDIRKELKICQIELQNVNNWNHQHLIMLMESSRRELARQTLKKKLDKIDKKVRRDYMVRLKAKKAKKMLTEKQRKKFWNDLKERTRVIRELYAE